MQPQAVPKNISQFLTQSVQQLAKPADAQHLYKAIVNAPFKDKLATTILGVGIIVLLIKNQASGTLDRIALSQTEQAEGAVSISVKPFTEIRIPLSAHDNALIQAMHSQEHRILTDWKYLFIPALTAQEARLNQAGAGIDCSVVYPLNDYENGGAMIFSYYEPMSRLTNVHHDFMRTYSTACAKALQAL